MGEIGTTPGFIDLDEGTPLEALKSALPLRGRVKMYARIAVGTVVAYASFGRELATDGLICAEKKHQERMRQMGGEVVYRTLQDYPELFQPERLLAESIHSR